MEKLLSTQFQSWDGSTDLTSSFSESQTYTDMDLGLTGGETNIPNYNLDEAEELQILLNKWKHEELFEHFQSKKNFISLL